MDVGVPTASERTKPLCVDMDGTVLRTDLLFESFAACIRHHPLLLVKAPFWLMSGRAVLKRELASRYEFDPALLPYNEPVIEFLRTERARGRKVILVTASDREIAQKVADHLGVFDEVMGSDGARNLKGTIKAEFLSAQFGAGNFDYIGDSPADMSVWKAAGGGGVVTSSDNFYNGVSAAVAGVTRFSSPKLSAKTLIKAIRAHQWVKNILIFVPLILAHHILTPGPLFATIKAFVAFSFCASVVYIINDLLDLETDRQHPSKRNRPFASGNLPLQSAFILVPLLVCGAVLLAWDLPLRFIAILGTYFIVTFGYSFYFKQVMLMDVVLLAALYSIRLLAGGAAAQVGVSQWLVAFAMFFFFSLACVKRYSELFSLRLANEERTKGRGYRATDLEQIGIFGSSSAYLSILILALYVNSQEVAALYRHPGYLWLLCPVVLYWVSRVWLLAHRGEMHDDPIVFALTDKVSYLVGLITALIVLFAV